MSNRNNHKSRNKKPDVNFTTTGGTVVKLVYDKEYRAFKLSGDSWIPMMLGGCVADTLREYIEQNY